VKGRKMAKKKTGKKFRVVKTSKGSYITNKKKPRKLSQKQLIKAIGKLMTRVDTKAMDELLEKRAMERKKFIEEHSEQWAKDREALSMLNSPTQHPAKRACIDLNEEKMNTAIVQIREYLDKLGANAHPNEKRTVLQDIYKLARRCFDVFETISMDSEP
jgi:hypothetical protein